jgi:CheY-like chemotaxis protein
MPDITGENIVRPGQTACFLHAILDPVLNQSQEEPIRMTTTPLAGLRALVADDNPINLQIIDTFLKRLGLVPQLVEDGRQAVDAWAPGKFDILCFDIAMPELDGIAALQHIQARARAMVAPMTPAVAITANAQPHQLQSYLAAGFDDNLAKPVSRAELARVISAAIAQTTTPHGA